MEETKTFTLPYDDFYQNENEQGGVMLECRDSSGVSPYFAIYILKYQYTTTNSYCPNGNLLNTIKNINVVLVYDSSNSANSNNNTAGYQISNYDTTSLCYYGVSPTLDKIIVPFPDNPNLNEIVNNKYCPITISNGELDLSFSDPTIIAFGYTTPSSTAGLPQTKDCTDPCFITSSSYDKNSCSSSSSPPPPSSPPSSSSSISIWIYLLIFIIIIVIIIVITVVVIYGYKYYKK